MYVNDDGGLLSQGKSIFFFSSRSRHTRYWRDWSSDVCSSDLFAHYVTDTEPGSSGSPVLNDQLQVIGLHHSAVPERKDGEYVAKDGSVWREGMDPDDLSWVANEGVRVSSIVNYIKKTQLAGERASLRDEMLTSEPPDPLEAAAMAAEGESTPSPAGGGDGSFTWTIPLQVTVNLGPPSWGPGPVAQPTVVPGGQPPRLAGGTGQAGAGMVAGPTETPPSHTQEAISIDPDYGSRRGYDPDFLGTATRSVPLPELSEDMKSDAAVNGQADAPDDYVLPYHHFSVVMNGRRKLAYFTAVNIDGKRAQEIERENDRWFLDPRIGEDEQTGEAVYANNPLDRGHLVRRLDPAWGDSPEE